MVNQNRSKPNYSSDKGRSYSDRKQWGCYDILKPIDCIVLVVCDPSSDGYELEQAGLANYGVLVTNVVIISNYISLLDFPSL
ncbi:hypothetical protein GIB67_042588, partial [Kingdonia uniflora]